MKENRHKAEDVLTRPWPGRQKEREDSERKRRKRTRQINIKREEEKGTTECLKRLREGDIKRERGENDKQRMESKADERGGRKTFHFDRKF